MNDDVADMAAVTAMVTKDASPAAEQCFDDAGYLLTYPDVAEAVRRGICQSGYDHYISVGFREGRACGGFPQGPRNKVMAGLAPTAALVSGNPPMASMETVAISTSGGLLLIGWVDDAFAPLDCIRLVGPSWQMVIDAAKLVRTRRTDVEQVLNVGPRHLYGFLGFVWTGHAARLGGPCVAEVWIAGHPPVTVALTPRHVDDVELRNTVLGYLAGASFLGNRVVEAIGAIGSGLGAEIGIANRAINACVAASPYVERFGHRAGKLHGSIIIVLFGKPEFLFLQNCLYSGLQGSEGYEFIFVCNSPEIAEMLLREARIADLVYGLQQTLVILPANIGFGAANNVGAKLARSDRVLIVNPDVFPREADWARKHTDLVDSLPAGQSRLFGVPMYYDDGSLMHGGMYFEIDRGLSLSGDKPRTVRMARVEHYGKGAPPDTDRYVRARPVPAVGGAFMSCERGWFERLDGFNEDYVFGHYEDADLCLASIARDTVPWLQDVRMWHFEGKGSVRQPAHDGAALVNRWLFSSRWCATIEQHLLGPAPTHRLLQPPAAPALAGPRPAQPAADTPPPSATAQRSAARKARR
jgi:hypothetical protein